MTIHHSKTDCRPIHPFWSTCILFNTVNNASCTVDKLVDDENVGYKSMFNTGMDHPYEWCIQILFLLYRSDTMPPTRAPKNYSDFVCVDDFEQYALRVLPVNTKDYYKSGACAQETLANNKAAFRRLVLLILFENFKFDIEPRPKAGLKPRPQESWVLETYVLSPRGRVLGYSSY